MQLIIRLAVRITALALKFALTIAVARTLGFSAVADYGLALAISVLSSKLLGLGFSAEMNRRLSLKDPFLAIRDLRRLLVLYAGVYAVLAAMTALFYVSRLGDIYRLAPEVLLSILAVAFSEHFGFETNSYVFSLHRPRFGAVLLFLRTGGWAAVAIAGMMGGMIRSMAVVFGLWWLTNILVAFVACWFIWRRKRELEMTADRSTEKVRDVNLRSVWIGGFPFFVATVVLSALQYAERFFASEVVSRDALGRYVFSWSIANAVQTVAYATIVVTAGPRLVRSIGGSDSGFRALLGRSARLTLCVTLAASAVILLAHKPIFRLAHEFADTGELAILLTLLASFVLRSVADLYWSGAIALRLGKQVAISISFVAAVSVPIEWLLVSRMGAMGAAMAHLIASVGILVLLMAIVARRCCSVALKTQNEASHAS